MVGAAAQELVWAQAGEREAGWEVTGGPGTKNFCHAQNRPCRGAGDGGSPETPNGASRKYTTKTEERVSGEKGAAVCVKYEISLL